ncbi:phage portal protein [Hydrogenophaga atypica]|uniref:Phage portal protein n=1 Tax=Hydrogenophaga atypica TaxID=249409 RepID=A0ABW2QI36_9BURK
MTTTTWDDVQARATVPGSPILTQWRAEREATRAIRNAGNGATETIASSDPRVVELFGSNRAAAGMAVTAESAMRVSAVYGCVTRIAGVISQLPVNVYERIGTGRKLVEDTPYWWMLNEQPTARFTAASMWEQITSHKLLRESGFVFIGRSKSGAVRELIPLPYEAVQPDRVQSGERLKYFVQDVRTYGCDQDDMLHFPGFGFDGLRARSVIQWAARNATGNAMAMDEYSGRFFANGSHHSIVIEAPGQMKQPAVDALQQAYANKYSGLDNAHRLPLVLTDGLKAKEVSISAQDAQLLDARKFQVVDIARAFGVPPHLIGETSAATSWGSGLEEMTRAFMLFTIQPHLKRLEQELNRKLFRTSRYFFEFDRDAMLEGNSKAQADYFRAALGGPGSGQGWMTADEIRRKKNLPPQGGEADKLFHPGTAGTKTTGAQP